MTDPNQELANLINLVQQLQGQIRDQEQMLQQHQAQIQAPPAPPRIKPDRPPPFNGRKTESLEAWIFQMQQFCILAPIPEADRIQFAATFLKDQAACGGDLTTKPSTGKMQLPTGMVSSQHYDSNLCLSTPALARTTASNVYPRKPRLMPIITNSEPSCWNFLTWTRPPA